MDLPKLNLGPGVHEHTPEYLAQRKAAMDKLSASEKAALDPNQIHPDVAHNATIFFVVLTVMLIFLIGFVLTCRNNKKKMMAQREIEKYAAAALSDEEDQENEMRNFSEFFGDNKDSDEEDGS